jgi:gas vesicle GvpC-like protein
MALKDSWDQRRQERLAEVAQRRQQVSALLNDTQQQRQEKAAVLRGDLDLFRTLLTTDVATQRQEFQQYHRNLQQETQLFLSQARARREAMAQIVSLQLSEFVDRLQSQTAEFLSVTSAERKSMAQQLAYDLQTFRTALAKAIVVLRSELQTEVQGIQSETQALLEEAYLRRVQMGIQQAEDLANFVAILQADVQAYLSEVSLDLSLLFQDSREQREAQVQELFQQFGVFRSQLQTYCLDIKNLVWGELEGAIADPEPPAPKKIEPKVEPKKIESKPALAATMAPVKAEKKGFAAEKYIKPDLLEAIEDQDIEEKIFQFIDSVKEARLTEIESALDMSRYKAIETLRSLIQKGMIVQVNRVYRIAQEFSR